MSDLITIVIDTREQAALAFSTEVDVCRATLPAGDYSLLGYEDQVGIERKSAADGWSTMYTAPARKRIARVLDVLGQYQSTGGLGIVAIDCSRSLFMRAPTGMESNHARRIRGTWEEMCGARGVEICWGAGSEEVERRLVEWWTNQQEKTDE